MALPRLSQLALLLCALLLAAALPSHTEAFSVSKISRHRVSSSLLLMATANNNMDDSVEANTNNNAMSRRSLFQSAALSSIASLVVATVANPQTALAAAAQRAPLESSLYTILRVREATQQESRLIKSGKFKDLQRANVKLAVKFMIDNYRLGDAFVAASSYLDGNDRRVAAVNVGQNAVQDLYTILEYFDSSDVQNLKIGSASLSSDKEAVVLKGLDATRRSIDEFLAYFPKDTIDSVKVKVKDENDLNFKEFDRNLGDIVNPNPTV